MINIDSDTEGDMESHVEIAILKELLTLPDHPKHPTTISEIDSDLKRNKYVSAVGALEMYRPCGRKTATKLWNAYKKDHSGLDISVHKIALPSGRRSTKTDCVKFDIIRDLLNANKFDN